MLLADMGAEVLLVEQPRQGDPARLFPAFFETLNRGKHSITLDLKTTAGREICSKLLASADVFLEGFRPGVMERLGLGPEEVGQKFPSLIYCSISGYGQGGTYRDRVGHDLSYHDLSYLGTAGMLTGEEISGLQPGLAIGDLSSGMFATIGILAALFERHESTRGQYIDVSMADGLVSWMATALAPLLNGEENPAGTREPAYGIFECKDGKKITLSIVHEDHFWRNLCTCLRLDQLASLRGDERRRRRPELRQEIAARLESEPADYWLNAFDELDVAAGPASSPADVISDRHFRERHMFVETKEERGGSRWHVRQPLKFSRSGILPPLGLQASARIRILHSNDSAIRPSMAGLRADGVI